MRHNSQSKYVPQLAILINKGRLQLAQEDAPRRQLEGAAQYIEKMGYRMDVFNLADRPVQPSWLKEILFARGIQGIIFIDTTAPSLPEEYLELGKHFACAYF